MKYLLDVINFNPDASCLDSGAWLQSLRGGKRSPFHQWLSLYVTLNKKVVLGMTGAGVADLAMHNPECIDVIKQNRHIFEVIVRPFSHDISLLRTPATFSFNMLCGNRTIRKEFHNVYPGFLPPEFMLTGAQIDVLKKNRIETTFINPERFSEDMQARIPGTPYVVTGILGSKLNCIPFHEGLTHAYLRSLYRLDSNIWSVTIARIDNPNIFFWRDGESPFLVPSGHEREKFWLQNETGRIRRVHLRDLELSFLPPGKFGKQYYRSYPIHSFSSWMKEFRMFGFLNRVSTIENGFEKLPLIGKFLFLNVINSDILSAVEKKSHTIDLRRSQQSNTSYPYIIYRTERGHEGEEILALLESFARTGVFPDVARKSRKPHLMKLRKRIQYLEKTFPENGFE